MKTLSIKQMQHLQSLGLDCSKASMTYYIFDGTQTSWDKEKDEYIVKYDNEPFDIKELKGKWDIDDDLSDSSLSECVNIIPCFVLDDILDMLPCLYPMHEIKNEQEIKRRNFKGSAYCPNLYKEDDVYYMKLTNNNLESLVSFSSDLAIDAAYQLLIWCIENGHIKTNKNERN